MKPRITVSKGNVFEDLGFSGVEAAELKLRSDLMIRISDVIRRRRLTQSVAASVMGVAQPRVSDLVRGKLHLFSVDTLVAMLARLGATVEVVVHERPLSRLKSASVETYAPQGYETRNTGSAGGSVGRDNTWRSVPLVLVAASSNARNSGPLLRGEAA